MTDMKIVGITTQQTVYAASQKRQFRINEILIIEDPNFGNVKAEVIETQSFNQFIPLTSERNKFVDQSVLENLQQIGYSIEDQDVHLAKLRTVTELIYPVRTGSSLRLPLFNEISQMLIKDPSGWTMGMIQGTEEVAQTMDESLKNKGYTFNPEKGVFPFSGVPFILPFKEMYNYPHIGLFGGSGSGKSHAVRVMLEEIQKNRIPGIVFDPHYEMEFKDVFEPLSEVSKRSFKPNYEVVTLGREVGIPFTELSVHDLISLLSATSANFTDGMDNVIRTLFHPQQDTLERFIMKLRVLIEFTTDGNQLKQLHQNRDSLSEKERVSIEEKYGIFERYGSNLNNSAILGGVLRRINRLNHFGLFKGNVDPIIQGLKSRKLVIIRGSVEHLSLFGSYLVRKVYELRRNYLDSLSQGVHSGEWFPPFLIIGDEAHNFAPKSFDTPIKRILVEISQEGRKYGVFLVVASQRPALLDDTIMAQLNTKYILRTVRGNDIKSLSEETDLTPQDTARLPYLTSGDAFVSSAILGRTFFVRIRAAYTKSPVSKNPFDELDEFSTSQTLSNPIYNLVMNEMPFDDSQLFKIVKKIESVTGIFSIRELNQILEELIDQSKIIAAPTPFGKDYYPA